jgi:hypothetical protein
MDIMTQINRKIIPTNPAIPQREAGDVVIGKMYTIFAKNKEMALKVKAAISKTYFTS